MRTASLLLWLSASIGCEELKGGADKEPGIGCMGSKCATLLQLSAGGSDHTCALKSDTTVWCWGSNQSGELGLGTTANSPLPVVVPGILAVSDVSVGGSSTCVAKLANTSLVTNTEGWCWGGNGSGQLGDGTTQDRHSPVQSLTFLSALANDTEAEYMRLGATHSCTRAGDFHVFCWGDDAAGENGSLSVSTQSCSSTPCRTMATQVLLNSANGLFNVEDMSSGDRHSCALSAGDVWCWGSNVLGELGVTPPDDSPHPTPKSARVSGMTEIALGGKTSCAVSVGGAAVCWGDNSSGQLGIGGADGDGHPSASTVTDLYDGVSDISVGPGHVCARKQDRSLWCWGKNDSGQIGDGTTEDRPAPVQVMEDVVEVTVGAAHTCARKVVGTLWCWGRNDQGQLGIGSADTNPHPKPSLVSGLP